MMIDPTVSLFSFTCFIGLEKCKFSQFQKLKVQKKAYDRMSTYCPVDLFSGSKKRMRRAIKALVSDPQNNFRVFRLVQTFSI